MAKSILKNPSIIINSVDLSNQIEGVTIDRKVDTVEVTAFQDTVKNWLTGLEDDKLTLDWFQDFSTASVHQTLAPLVGTTTAVSVKPVNAATSTANPAFTFNVLVADYPILSGKVSQANKISTTWQIVSAITEHDS